MLGLPVTTEISRQLPKKAIYTKFCMNTAAKDKFDNDISRITIVNIISPATTNFEKGENISEFCVLLVSLKNKEYDEKNIAMLSNLIPQNILYILEYEGNSQLAVYHTKLIHSEWKSTEKHEIQLKGLDLDSVWENVVMQIGSVDVQHGNTLEEQIIADEQRAKIEKEIARLEKMARAEKQPKKKFELVSRIKELNKEISEYEK